MIALRPIQIDSSTSVAVWFSNGLDGPVPLSSLGGLVANAWRYCGDRDEDLVKSNNSGLPKNRETELSFMWFNALFDGILCMINDGKRQPMCELVDGKERRMESAGLR